VEPSQGMRDQFSRIIRDDRITLTDGVFQCTGVEDGWADLVVVAQVWDAACTTYHVLTPVNIRVSIGALISMQLRQNSRAFSNREELLPLSGISKIGKPIFHQHVKP